MTKKKRRALGTTHGVELFFTYFLKYIFCNHGINDETIGPHGPALSGKIKVHFFVSLAVQFQYFRGREPDLFHEQVKRAILKREGYVVVLRYPNTRVIVPNKQNFIFIHGYISCLVKYRAYPASFQWPFQDFFQSSTGGAQRELGP